MRESLTSSVHDLDTFGKINQNDPKQLLKIIGSLISKSKTIIKTLDATVIRLERMEKQKNYWKSGYLRFRDACQKYIDADGMNHLRNLSDLQDQIKKIQIDKICLQEQSRIVVNHHIINKNDGREEQSLNGRHDWKQSLERSQEPKTKRKQKIHKSISTVSFNKDSGHHSQMIAPKKVCILRSREKVFDGNI